MLDQRGRRWADVPSILRVFADIGPTLAQGKKDNRSFCQRQPTVSYRRLSSVYLPTLGQRWLKVRKPTVILSASAQSQLQTSIRPIARVENQTRRALWPSQNL